MSPGDGPEKDRPTAERIIIPFKDEELVYESKAKFTNPVFREWLMRKGDLENPGVCILVGSSVDGKTPIWNGFARLREWRLSCTASARNR